MRELKARSRQMEAQCRMQMTTNDGSRKLCFCTNGNCLRQLLFIFGSFDLLAKRE